MAACLPHHDLHPQLLVFDAHTRRVTCCILCSTRNSEIYNHEEVRAAQLAGCEIKTTSDSAIVGYMYGKMGDCEELWNSLDGIFACVIVDERTGHFCAARDAMGICSFYWGKGHDGSIWFASELKSLQDNCETFEFFPPVSICCLPGHPASCRQRLMSGSGQAHDGLHRPTTQGFRYSSKTGKLERWYKPSWINEQTIPSQPLDLSLVRVRHTGMFSGSPCLAPMQSVFQASEWCVKGASHTVV
jgi:asparagine synthase (glutamine-hydrolysing)